MIRDFKLSADVAPALRFQAMKSKGGTAADRALRRALHVEKLRSALTRGGEDLGVIRRTVSRLFGAGDWGYGSRRGTLVSLPLVQMRGRAPDADGDRNSLLSLE